MKNTEDIKYFSYQDLDGTYYIDRTKIERNKFSLKKKNFSIYQQKEFVSPGLKFAAKLERGKRQLQSKVEDTFGLGKIIDPATGSPVKQDAKKRKLIAAGAQPQTPELVQPKPTELGKDGKVDLFAAGRRIKRKVTPLVGKGINAGIDLVDQIAYPVTGAVLTPGRTLSKGIEKSIENPIGAITYGLSYAAPFIGGTAGNVIMAVDNAIPNPVQFKMVDKLTPAPAKRWLNGKAVKFKEGVGKSMNQFQWADIPKAVGKVVQTATTSSPNPTVRM